MSAPMEIDKFKDCFKYFKRKDPIPDLNNVIKFPANQIDKVYIIPVHKPCLPVIAGLKDPEEWKIYGLHSVPGFYFIENPFKPGYQRYWVYRCLYDYPVKPHVTNMDSNVNLGPQDNIWDKSGGKRVKKNLLDKLRWATLGYHYDWTNKIYEKEKFTHFPDDLQCLSKYISAVLGFKSFTAEAAIVNYYHLDSTLSGHTDHSEFDKEAPLISVSFGQPCIFLLGGATKQIEPLAMFLNSGDIIVMSGACRLSYHAVPKVIPTNSIPQCFNLSETLQKGNNCDKVDPTSLNSRESEAAVKPLSCVTCDCTKRDTDAKTSNTEVSEEDPCNVCDKSEEKPAVSKTCTCLHHKAELNCKESVEEMIVSVNEKIENTLQTIDWEPFGSYIKEERINMNVRQVFYPGQCWPEDTQEAEKGDSERPDKKVKLDLM